MTESQSPIFAHAAAALTSNKTLRLGVPQDTSRHALSHDGLLTDQDQLLSAVHFRTPDESPSSIVLESPQAKLQTGKCMFYYTYSYQRAICYCNILIQGNNFFKCLYLLVVKK